MIFGWPNGRPDHADGWVFDHPTAFRDFHSRPAECRWCGGPTEPLPSWAFRCTKCDVPKGKREPAPSA